MIINCHNEFIVKTISFWYLFHNFPNSVLEMWVFFFFLSKQTIMSQFVYMYFFFAHI